VGIGLNYLDTYALVEIGNDSPNYSVVKKQDYKLCDITLCEFYGIMLRDFGEKTADDWLMRLAPASEPTSLDVLIEAVKFRQAHKSLNLSFWDAVGYQHALSNHGIFVTGDKAFEKLPHVKYVK
jgi:hypothetical protein